MAADVIVAGEFFDAATRLSSTDKASAVEFISQFRENPAHPSLRLHRLTGVKSKGMWSARIGRGPRAILHKDGDTWVLLYAAKHDDAYDWARRRDVGRHPVTGSLQIVESVETVREVERVVSVAPKAPPLFAGHGDDYLTSLGVPVDWLPTVRRIREEDDLLSVCEKLPQDVSERLLSLGAGEFVTPPPPLPPERPVTEAQGIQARFYVVEDEEGLAAALRAPMDRWIAFLHPSQREFVAAEFSGPSKVSGSAGTGKTVVAMHRARHLAKLGEDVLLTSYVRTLCDNIQHNLRKFCREEELARITVSTVHKQARSIARTVEPRPIPADPSLVRRHLYDALELYAPGFDADFVRIEWEEVVRAQGIDSWAEYRGAQRTGRGQGLGVAERKRLWQVFGAVLDRMREANRLDWPGMSKRAAELIESGKASSPFTAVIVDEVQDLNPPDLRFLCALCANRPENLMVCGDAGQRIYSGGFSLKALGIDVRGRARVLRINYRTTEQIRKAADQVLGSSADDMDGGVKSRAETRSLLRGPVPELHGYESREEEDAAGVALIKAWLDSGLRPDAVGVFGRTRNRIGHLADALSEAGVPCELLSDRGESAKNAVSLGTMHRAKGLEFKCVLTLGCGDSVLPNRHVLRRAKEDPSAWERALNMEKRLLYVAMTRARDELRITWKGKPSRFLAELTDGAGASGETPG